MTNRRSVLVLAVILLARLPLAAQPNHSSKHEKRKTAESNPSVVPNHSDNPETESRQDQTGTSDNAPSLHTPIERTVPFWKDSNWILVVVGTITAGVVAWQSWETRRSGKATSIAASAALRQTELQVAAMRQWVEFNPHQSMVDPYRTDNICFSFALENPTNLLLIVEKAKLRMSATGYEVTFVSLPAPLTPKTPQGFSTGLPVNRPDSFMAYAKGGTIGLEIEVSVTFVSAMQERFLQRFVGIMSFKGNEVLFEPTVSIERQDDRQRPN